MDVGLLLQTLLQMYGMMLLGFIMAKTGILDDHVNRKLSTMVVAVVYPLMLLYSMTGQEGDPWEAVAMLAVGFAVYIGMILAAKVFTRLLRVPEQKRLEFECLLVFGNTGFIGAPLAQSLYGNAAFFQMTLLNFAYYFFYNTYAVSTLSASEGKRQSLSWRALFTPGFVMTLLAIVLYFLRFDPPAPVGQLFQTAGNMTTPLSMIILDDLERLVEYVRLGPRFSNSVLQALLVLIKKIPPTEGRKLMIIATTSQRTAMEELGLMDVGSEGAG